ncbi:Transcriptional regulator, MerR family [Labilithrix luteola]|uniref:Transcriptional regulator, MerR family n=1 Tax=Labilithrix luteola TaxID=1391654 RepID=A0A0K1QBV1_9BACT|nr:MerR family transcriptional regulator [Labilithrix luteola]AKV02905.1 Transcriptional regulator, MerR family [Labilithrix luteola]
MPLPPGTSGASKAKRSAAPAGNGPYRINVAAELSGVAAATLRAWERRYGVPVPRRTASAYRLYTPEDVDQVRRMRELVESGVSPAEAARVVRSTLPPPEVEIGPVGGDAVEGAANRVLAAIARFDVAGVDAEIARLTMLLDAQTFYEHIVSPLLVEVGLRWARGELSVAQEHLLSERLEYAMRVTLRTLERPEGPLVLLACIEDEHHVLGMLGASLRFASSGARVVVLGAATPPSAIADAVRSMSPRLVGLSACAVPASARATMRAYGEACDAVPWVLGGTAANDLKSVIEHAGGTVAVGTAREWQSNLREWLRVPTAATPARATRRGGR